MNRKQFLTGGALFAATALLPKPTGAQIVTQPVQTAEDLKAVGTPSFMTTITSEGKMFLFSDRYEEGTTWRIPLIAWNSDMSDEEFNNVLEASKQQLLDRRVLGIQITIPNLGWGFETPTQLPITVRDLTNWRFDPKATIDVYYASVLNSKIAVEYGVFHAA